MPVPQMITHFAPGELHPSERLAKLGRALVAMSRDLAESRREIAALRRENAELRRRLGHS